MSPFRMHSTEIFATWQLEGLGDCLLREEDKAELRASTGLSAGKALVDACDNSERSWICYSRETRKPIGVFGYAKHIVAKGVVIWMVATPEIYKHINQFKDVSVKIIDYWLSKFGVLHGFIDTRNAVHVRWLEGLGFSFPEGNTAILFDDVPFQLFIKEKANV